MFIDTSSTSRSFNTPACTLLRMEASYELQGDLCVSTSSIMLRAHQHQCVGCHGPLFKTLKLDPAIRLFDPWMQGLGPVVVSFRSFPRIAKSRCQSLIIDCSLLAWHCQSLDLPVECGGRGAAGRGTREAVLRNDLAARIFQSSGE